MQNAIEKIGEYRKFGSKLGLSRMTELLSRLGNPEQKLKVIHVAGTNGKGSVSRFIYETLQNAGYKVGLYTSPYLVEFNERIEFDKRLISDEELSALTRVVTGKAEEMVSEGQESPTEFEIITAIAFLYFRNMVADYVVLEVGLGGRGDSTNVIKEPLVSVISSISFDHTDRLGNTIEEIAGEKAGIIKDGCPVIARTGDDIATKVIAEKARELGALFIDAANGKAGNVEMSMDGTTFDAHLDLGEGPEAILEGVKVSMPGVFQIDNALLALTVLEFLESRGIIDIPEESMRAGLEKGKQIGRFEVMAREPYVVIDGAHNVGGVTALARTVKELMPGARVLLMMGVLKDKDYEEMAEKLLELGDDMIICEPLEEDRKLAAADLAETVRRKGGNPIVAMSVEEGVDKALFMKDDYDLLLISGSLYLIGEVRKLLVEKL